MVRYELNRPFFKIAHYNGALLIIYCILTLRMSAKGSGSPNQATISIK